MSLNPFQFKWGIYSQDTGLFKGMRSRVVVVNAIYRQWTGNERGQKDEV